MLVCTFRIAEGPGISFDDFEFGLDRTRPSVLTLHRKSEIFVLQSSLLAFERLMSLLYFLKFLFGSHLYRIDSGNVVEVQFGFQYRHVKFATAFVEVKAAVFLEISMIGGQGGSVAVVLLRP